MNSADQAETSELAASKVASSNTEALVSAAWWDKTPDERNTWRLRGLTHNSSNNAAAPRPDGINEVEEASCLHPKEEMAATVF